MKVLLVTPVKQGSGETITSMHIAEDLVSKGHTVLFLASRFARRFIQKQFPSGISVLTGNGARNHSIWKSTLRAFRPDVIVFADFPLMFFPGGTVPLALEPGWLPSLEALRACLVTLDHFGFAQRETGLFMGPPHLGLHYQEFPPQPENMHVLLPCPMHEPGEVKGRKGLPFRYWTVPLHVPKKNSSAARRKYLRSRDDFLVFHSVPSWAWRHATALGLTFYKHLPKIFECYFGKLERPVTIVSVNNGRLLASSLSSRVRIINLGPVPKSEFESLLFCSDLVITENKLSISLGKAICGLQPCAALKNSYRLVELMERVDGRLREAIMAMEHARLGAVFPFEVFPTVAREQLDEIGLYRGNTITKGFWELEIYGGENTGCAVSHMLTDAKIRSRLASGQHEYIRRLRRLDGGTEVLTRLLERDRSLR
jgi:hypothetical protein